MAETGFHKNVCNFLRFIIKHLNHHQTPNKFLTSAFKAQNTGLVSELWPSVTLSSYLHHKNFSPCPSPVCSSASRRPVLTWPTQRLSVWGPYLTCQVLCPIAAVPGPVSELSDRFLTTLWVAPQTVGHIWSLTLPSAYENKLIFLKDICTKLFSKWLVLALTIKGDIITFSYKTLKNQVSELLSEPFHEKLWVYTIWPVVWLA